MTLGKIIEIHKEKLGDVFEIRYRMMATDGSGTMRDVGLSGLCRYERGSIVSGDGDGYGLSDEVDAHTIKDGALIVWEDVTNQLWERYDFAGDTPVEKIFGSVEKHIEGA